jgi:FtsH-binding integral membrane protein
MSSYYPSSYDRIAAEASADARAAFIRNTYAHLAGAVLAFIGIETALLQVDALRTAAMGLLSQGGFLVIMVLFLGGSWVANYWALNATSRPLQYAGLGLYVVLEALVFFPILLFASLRHPDAITSAGILTGFLFAGLTTVVLTTKQDYSNLGPILSVGGMLALGFLVVCMLFGFAVPLFFMFAMVALAAGYILYDTSNVVHHYRTDQYVAAVALFASVALLFFYILRIFLEMSRQR